MSLFMFSQCIDVLRGEVVFSWHGFFFAYVGKRFLDTSWLGIGKIADSQIFAEADNKNPLPILRYTKIFGIDNLRFGNEIVQIFTQSVQNGLECPAFIVIDQPFYILQKKGFRPVAADDFGNIKKQRATRIFKSATLPSNRKGLAWKTSAQNIEFLRNEFFCFLFCDVAIGNFAEIGFIGLLGFLVPFAGKHTFSPQILHGNAETTYTCKQIDKGKFFVFWGRLKHHTVFKQAVLRCFIFQPVRILVCLRCWIRVFHKLLSVFLLQKFVGF